MTRVLMIVGVAAFLSCAIGASAEAKLRSVTISSDQEWIAPRWQYDAKAKIKGAAVVTQLVQVKKAMMERRFDDCVQAVRKVAGQAKGLKAWLATVELDCAYRGLAPDSKDLAALTNALQTIDQNPKWLLVGPQVGVLRPLYLEAQLSRFERQARVERPLAWRTYDVLQQWIRSLSDDQRARMLRTAGELAFVEQNLSLAADLYSRSLSERESAEVKRKLESVRATLGMRKVETSEPGVEARAPIEPPSEEGEIRIRMEQATQSGDLLSALEDGVKLIEKFPGGDAARKASDRVLDIYLSLAARNDTNMGSLRKKAVQAMMRADGARLYRWANNAYARGVYEDAARLAEAAVKKFAGHPDATKAIALAAHASLYIVDHGSAEKWYELLVKEHNGTEESRQALFRLGLIRLRAKKWGEGAAYFERLIALAPNTDWEYLSLYWLWRAQTQAKQPGAERAAERLVARYPLTYYGLRARAELNGGVLTFSGKEKNSAKTPNSPLKSELWLSESQSQGWERLQLLLRAGWFDEAQAELDLMPEPVTPEDRLVRARLLAAAFDHADAIRMFSETWGKRPDLFSWSDARAAFPVEFPDAIDKEARANQLEDTLVRGLIRQESSFRPRAVSAANAHGVMQVLPATAQEVAGNVRWKPALVLPDDLFNPDINIRIGSIYLSRMVRAFKGHVPLALAAYNAGIGRLRKWLAARADLGDVEGRLSSAPENEIWIDELPWEETSAYVKAVLRNHLVYQVFAKGEIRLQEPIWQATAP